MSRLDVSIFDEEEKKISRLLKKTKAMQDRLTSRTGIDQNRSSFFSSPLASRTKEPDLDAESPNRNHGDEILDPIALLDEPVVRRRRGRSDPSSNPPPLPFSRPTIARAPAPTTRSRTGGSGRTFVMEKYRSANLAYERREFTTAVELFGQALTFYGRYRLDDTIILSNIFIGMGNSYYCQGLFDTAFDMYSRVDDTIQEDRVLRVRGLITPNMNMGLVCFQRKQYGEAVSYYLKALKAAENIIGLDRLVLADIYHNIGSAFDSQGNLVGAIKMYKKSLRIREKLQGKKHSLTALTYENMAMILKDLRKFSEAQNLQKQVIRIRRTFVGPDNCDFAMGLHKMGLIYEAYGAKTKALYYFEKAHGLRARLLGDNHHLTKESYRMRNLLLNRT